MDDRRPRAHPTSPGGETGSDGTTIVAPATPPGAGAISLLRLSGPEAFSIAFRMTGADPSRVPARALVRCTVRDGKGEEFDSGLVVYFPAPKSFTGEDVAEIHMHGNPVLVEQAAAATCQLGAVPAEPGEFSRRAFQNGKMDLTQAEALADLIAAKTEGAARAALRQLKGGIREAISPLREQLFDLFALLEASIDFSEDEDVPPLLHSQVQERVSHLIEQVGRCLATYTRGHRFRDGATVAIAGVANVGKSRLLNRLLGEERAIVTEIPGTTRDYLSGEVSLAGIPLRLVDTAGLREAEDPVEREGVRRSREIIAGADLTLFVLDRSRPAHEGDREAYREVAGRPHLVLLNKRDLPASENGAQFCGPGRKETLPVSAKTGEGIDSLLREIARDLAPEEDAIMTEAPLTRIRHREAVRKAEIALGRAREASGNALPMEFIAADVREAAQALAELTGEIAPEEVLHAIFSTFCIGK
ncbi:MAG TPA: tRNA uridine-5-carboxymethylaminomethyl(34) synthesis GTPase MnmE [Candidatus Deferrimicrobiaceae bacterium]|nr:tRNA uridine-5-carboxymethylaminomethyl(34) synthesis GTPase MnmE [Candidatus Deferrimicrobiaceae bacterium]